MQTQPQDVAKAFPFSIKWRRGSKITSCENPLLIKERVRGARVRLKVAHARIKENIEKIIEFRKYQNFIDKKRVVSMISTYLCPRSSVGRAFAW